MAGAFADDAKSRVADRLMEGEESLRPLLALPPVTFAGNVLFQITRRPSMRKLNITLCLAVAAFAASASACENAPTQPDADVAVVASTTSNVQSRVTLCHRNSNEYVAITVADAAYDTHMAHGDRDADLNGECPDVLLSRLELTVTGSDLYPDLTVTVTLLPFNGEPESTIGSCDAGGGGELDDGLGDGGVCSYEVPTGATVVLEPALLSYLWDDGATSASRVIDRDLSVSATLST